MKDALWRERWNEVDRPSLSRWWVEREERKENRPPASRKSQQVVEGLNDAAG